MKKSDFIVEMAAKMNVTKKESARYLKEMVDILINIFQKGDTLILPGFAKFGVRQRAARSGRNPRSGKNISIPVTKAPYVRFSQTVKKLVNTAPATGGKKKK
jgi:DNA-binding protein HU-beta